MVNLDESHTNGSQRQPLHFDLSKPLALKPSANVLKLESNTKWATGLFEFLEPYEPAHLRDRSINGGGGKILSSHSLRTKSKPYELSRPQTKPPSNNQPDHVDSAAHSTNQSALLARLTSLSSTFKSIFVRPKSARQVSFEKFTTSTTSGGSDRRETTTTEFKLRLFSTNDVDQIDDNAPKMLTLDHQNRIEKLISANVTIESANQRLLMKQPQNLSIKPSTGCSSSSSASSTSSTSSAVSTMSSASSLASSIQSAKSILNSLAAPLPHHTESVSKPVELAPSVGSVKKWTCMICLSKHTLDVRVCSICGSSHNVNGDGSISVRPLLNSPKIGLNRTRLNGLDAPSNNTLRPLQLQNTNKYLQNKSWVCTHCHFANDSLKIVCMNCRASKQHPIQNGNEINMSHHSVQTKRKMVAAPVVDRALNRSNEENECGPEKSHKMVKTDADNKYCKNCSGGCEKSGSGESTKSIPLVTPTPQKPPSLFEIEKAAQESTKPTESVKSTPEAVTKPEEAAPIKTTASKWTCDTCLVQNTDDKTSCVCCMTARPGQTPEPIKPSKWKCDTCLVDNNGDKTECVCCATPKPGAAKQTDQVDSRTKFSALVASAALNQAAQTPINKSISFGLAAAASKDQPIKFGSSFGVNSAEGPNKPAGFSIGLSESKKQDDKPSGFSFGTPKTSDEKKTESETSIKFGAAPVEKTSTSGLSFGQSVANTDNKPSESSTFKFGSFTASNSASQPTNNEPSGLKFGATSSNPFGSTSEASKPATTFVFPSGGQPSTTEPASKSSTPFSFGAQPKTTEPPKPSDQSTPFSFGAASEPAKPAAAPQFLFGASQPPSEPAKPTTPFSFGAQSQPTTETPKPAFSFGSANQTSTNEPSKPAPFSFGASTNNTTGFGFNSTASKPAEGPSTFSFGSSSTSTASKPAEPSNGLSQFGTNSSTLFKFGFTSSCSTGSTSSAATDSGLFNSFNKPAEATTTPVFGSTSNSTANTTIFGSANQSSTPSFNFGASASKPSDDSKPFGFGPSSTSSAFAFGAQPQSTSNAAQRPVPFQFGSESTAPKVDQSPFTFGSSNAFTFNGNDPNMTPSRNNAPSQQSTPSSAFVFTGAGNESSSVAPNLAQVLTPTSRVIKKPTRRLMKK